MSVVGAFAWSIPWLILNAVQIILAVTVVRRRDGAAMGLLCAGAMLTIVNVFVSLAWTAAFPIVARDMRHSSVGSIGMLATLMGAVRALFGVAGGACGLVAIYRLARAPGEPSK